MQHFCEPLKSAPHEAIYREMVAKYPGINPVAGSRQLKMVQAAAN
jgi:hypothetical protein